MTMTELVALLSRDERIDLSEFGKNGNRSIQTLLKQINEGDLRIDFDEEKKIVVIFRMSVWGILKTADGFSLVEVARWRPMKVRFLRIFAFWKWVSVPLQLELDMGISITETLKCGTETPEAAFFRGMQEEWMVTIPVEIFHPEYIGQGVHRLRLSTVYPGLWTRVFSSTYALTVPRRLCFWDPVAIDMEDDGPVIISLEWVRERGRESWIERLIRQFLSPTIRIAAMAWCQIRYY